MNTTNLLIKYFDEYRERDYEKPWDDELKEELRKDFRVTKRDLKALEEMRNDIDDGEIWEEFTQYFYSVLNPTRRKMAKIRILLEKYE